MRVSWRIAAALGAVLLGGVGGSAFADGDPYLVVRCGKQVRAAIPDGYDASRLPGQLIDLCNPGACQVMAWPERVRVPDCGEDHFADPVIIVGRSATGDLTAQTDCSRLTIDGAACLAL